MTPAGQEAAGIRDWVFEDPAPRARAGMARLNKLASVSEGQALREVQDMGRMVGRLIPHP